MTDKQRCIVCERLSKIGDVCAKCVEEHTETLIHYARVLKKHRVKNFRYEV